MHLYVSINTCIFDHRVFFSSPMQSQSMLLVCFALASPQRGQEMPAWVAPAKIAAA